VAKRGARRDSGLATEKEKDEDGSKVKKAKREDVCEVKRFDREARRDQLLPDLAQKTWRLARTHARTHAVRLNEAGIE
jgi:hypothetical protein